MKFSNISFWLLEIRFHIREVTSSIQAGGRILWSKISYFSSTPFSKYRFDSNLKHATIALFQIIIDLLFRVYYCTLIRYYMTYAIERA
jgi:hypothetical protein